jgi:hypothetical protein
MALRRTALLPPGWGPGRPRRTSIGASSAVGVAAGGAGMLLARGRGSGVAQIVFRQLTHFLLFCAGAQRRPSRRTGGSRRCRSPALFLLLVHASTQPAARACVCRVRGRVGGPVS